MWRYMSSFTIGSARCPAVSSSLASYSGTITKRHLFTIEAFGGVFSRSSTLRIPKRSTRPRSSSARGSRGGETVVEKKTSPSKKAWRTNLSAKSLSSPSAFQKQGRPSDAASSECSALQSLKERFFKDRSEEIVKAANVKKPKETRKAGPRSSPSVNEPPGKCGGTRTSPSASSPEVLPSPMLSWKENNSTSQKPSNLPSLSTEELEERDVRAAVRDMLHQHHLQKALRRRNAKMLAQEQKSSEQAALEWLEKELQRQGNRAHSAGLVREDGEGEEAEKSSPTEIIEALANALENKRGAVEETEKNAWSLTEMQRLHHHLRMKQRQEEKERNAARLCELSGSVEGVLPVSVSSPRGEQEDFGSRRTTPVNGKGVALSPKEVAAMEEAAEDALRMRNVMSLGNVKPDLSVYSIENDIRISSEQVVSVQRLEKERLERSRTSPSSASTSSLQEGVLSTTRTNPSLVGGVAGSPQVLSYAAQSASTCHGAEDFDLDEEKAIAATVKAYDEDDDL